LKHCLTTTPVLRIPNLEQKFELFTDASDKSLGAVLSQNGHPIAFTSRKLIDAEVNYPTHEKEFLAIINALRVWRHYLLDREIIIFTDHKPLQYMETQTNLSKRQARWMETYAEFKPKIIYKPGVDNPVADALSRISAIDSSVYPDRKWLSQIKEAYQDDEKLKTIIEDIQHGKKMEKYIIEDDLLYKISGHYMRLCLPRNDKVILKALQLHHDINIAGHFGFEKTYETLKQYYYWKNMVEDVKRYIAGCDTCQRTKTMNTPPHGLLNPLPIPSFPWEIVSMDFITGLPRTQKEFDAIFVVVDKLSKMAHFIPTTKEVTAEGSAKLFFDNIFRLHGMPKKIISDRDPRFTSKFWKTLMEIINVELNMSTTDHPETDGQTERVNRTLGQMLRAYTSSNQQHWDDALAAAEFAYNNAIQSSTKMSPFKMIYGRDPVIPSSLLTANFNSTNPSANDTLNQLSERIKIVQENIVEAQEYQKKYADIARSDCNFKEGEEVLLSTKNLQNEKGKLSQKFTGPFRISKVLSDVVYELELPVGSRIHPVFHVSKLKKYHTQPDGLQTEIPPPAPIMQPDGTVEYIVERILDKKKIDGKWHYLVKWKGYSESENSFEPLVNLRNCKALIKDYEERSKCGGM